MLWKHRGPAAVEGAIEPPEQFQACWPEAACITAVPPAAGISEGLHLLSLQPAGAQPPGFHRYGAAGWLELQLHIAQRFTATVVPCQKLGWICGADHRGCFGAAVTGAQRKLQLAGLISQLGAEGAAADPKQPELLEPAAA